MSWRLIPREIQCSSTALEKSDCEMTPPRSQALPHYPQKLAGSTSFGCLCTDDADDPLLMSSEDAPAPWKVHHRHHSTKAYHLLSRRTSFVASTIVQRSHLPPRHPCRWLRMVGNVGPCKSFSPLPFHCATRRGVFQGGERASLCASHKRGAGMRCQPTVCNETRKWVTENVFQELNGQK